MIGDVYASGLIISDAAEAIRNAEVREQEYITYAPPDLWARMKNNGVTVEEEFYRHGVLLSKSSNQRVPGWMQVHERLKVIDDVDGEAKTARLKIFSTCRNLIRCISTIKADERDCNDVATEPHELTHLPDALRYWCVMHTLTAKVPDGRTPEEKSLADYKTSRFRNAGSGVKIIRG